MYIGCRTIVLYCSGCVGIGGEKTAMAARDRQGKGPRDGKGQARERPEKRGTAEQRVKERLGRVQCRKEELRIPREPGTGFACLGFIVSQLIEATDTVMT